MQNYRNEVIPTGNSTVDSLMNLYNLDVADYVTYSGAFIYHSVRFQSEDNYNMNALAEIFDTISGVHEAKPLGPVGDGNDITSEIHPDHVELIYSVGWGDCPSGCNNRRFWKFKVYADCSVEYAGSYGKELPVTSIANINNRPSVEVFPNPFYNHINVKGVSSEFDFIFYNMEGKEMLGGKAQNSQIQNLSSLPAGSYVLQITSNSQVVTFKIMK